MANTLKLGAGKWATGKDTVLSFNDENGNFKPLPFSFSRASSATVVNQSGLIETVGSGEPRIDFLGNTKGALLLEPQRTNYVLYSETEGIIGGSNGWSGDSDNTITQNYGTTPFTGSELKSTRIQFTGSSKEFRNNISSVTITPTASIWIKGSVGRTIKFGSNSNEGIFTLNGEWQKLVQTGSSLSTNRLTINTYSSTTARDIEIFAPQLEQGSYATSYIPTSGSAVTRVADACNNGANEQVINSTEGVLYAEISAFDNISRISLSDGSSSNRVSFRIDANSIDFQYRIGGIYSYRVDVDIDTSNTNKIAMSFNNGVFVGYLNGVAIGSPISGASLGQGVLDRLNFNDGNSPDSFEGKAKDVRVYNTALTDAELIALTSN